MPLEPIINHQPERAANPWYDAVGPKGARAIVFIHGSTVTRVSWLPQIKSFSGEYRLILPDLPGHGALAGQTFDMETAVETAREAMDCEEVRRALVVGISLGGHVATLFAQRYPERVDGLVISGATTNFRGLLGAWVRFAAFLMTRVMNRDKLMQKAEANIRAKWAGETGEAILAAGVFPEGASQSFVELPRYDFRALVGEIRAPVLILNGENDKSNRAGEAAFLAAAQSARLAVVEGAGHACNIENPAAYDRELRKFMEEIGYQ